MSTYEEREIEEVQALREECKSANISYDYVLGENPGDDCGAGWGGEGIDWQWAYGFIAGIKQMRASGVTIPIWSKQDEKELDKLESQEQEDEG